MEKKDTEYDDGWNLTFDSFSPGEQKLRETLFTVGNGYVGTRGCFEYERASEIHYPGTYLAGVYNKLPSIAQEKEIFNTDLVNCPNWLLIELSLDGGEFVSPLSMTINHFEQNLDMRNAVVKHNLTVTDTQNRTTRIESFRFASMENPHYAVVRFTVIPLNYSGKIIIRSSIDGTVINNGVDRYKGLSSTHLQPVLESKPEDEELYLQVETTQSHTQIVVCFRNNIHTADQELQVRRSRAVFPGFICENIEFEAIEGVAITCDKIICITTSRDKNTASPLDSARAMLSRVISVDELLSRHSSNWHALWDTADMEIDGDPFAQKVIRLHMYHLLCAASPQNVAIDAGMPARGLHGEAYRGHIFWDSLFVLPFFFKRFPDVAKAALMYRYRRLDAARNYARENGYEGAMFPWQSADDGQEETQVIHFNPVSGKWDPDLSSRQRHVSIAIFYNVREYLNYSGDTDFFNRFGAEMLIEIARFWASIAVYEKHDKRYHIRGVMGPDEFHEKYPWSERGGIDDNAYTNIMTVWIMKRAIEAIEALSPEAFETLSAKINFDMIETKKWKAISSAMYVPISSDGIIYQFDRYLELKDLDLGRYKAKYGNISRMDRILKSQGDSPDNYKIAKQADTLMLFFVLSAGEVIEILGQLGYPVSDRKEFLRKNYDYYLKRTSHGSTLSKVVHAAISKEMSSSAKMWRWFMEAMQSDIYDTQGGTTIEGIHCGVMAGTINIIIRCFAGLSFYNRNIDISPSLPESWNRLKFKLYFNGMRYRFEITHTDVNVSLDIDGGQPLKIRLSKESRDFSIGKKTPAAARSSQPQSSAADSV